MTKYKQFVRSLIERGLRGVRLVVGDRCAGLVATVNSMLPDARYQRCTVHFMRNVLSKVPPTHREWASAALMLICARIRYVTVNDWSSRRYLNMSRLGDTMQTTD